MPDAVLPALLRRVLALVRVSDEPVVNLSEPHSMPRNAQQRAIYELRVGLVFISVRLIVPTLVG